MNGENNKAMLKNIPKDKQEKWMSTYTSTARTLYRGCWFFDFLFETFNGFSADRETKLSTVAANAYNKALGPHHPWLLRKTAGLAMNAVNYRNVFIQNVVKEQSKVQNMEYTEENVYSDFAILSAECKVMAEHMWKLCKAKGFD